MLDPPIPMAIPRAAIKNETGNTTFIAAMAIEPIQLPTKIVSTKIFKDITKIPIEAGNACCINNADIESVPSNWDFVGCLEFIYGKSIANKKTFILKGLFYLFLIIRMKTLSRKQN